MIKVLSFVLIAAASILLLPLLAMQITDEVDWDLADFAVAGVLFVGTGLAYGLVARKSRNVAYRFAIGVMLAAALLIIWMNLAVGIIGNEGNPANWIFIGVLAVAFTGAIIARLEPNGMARAMFMTALVQLLVPLIALIAGLGSGPIWPWDILISTGFFAGLWVGSALLFRSAARAAT